MKNAAKKILSVFLALLMLIPTGIMSVFAQAEDASSADTETDVSYDSTNAVGAMILDATQEGSGEEADYVIQSVDIEGKYARVDFINLDACAIVVAVYDESGKTMLGSGKEEIEAKEAVANDSVTVTIEIDEMPEYFLVKAFMLDENNAPLCHNYETKEYTQAFEEFLEKTTDDFDDDVIINLDNSENNNFLVVSDDAIVIDAKDGVNTVTTDDYENGLYVIENADSQITSLKPGDMIYYQYGDAEDEYILATVGSIDVDGDTVTITAAETGELMDYFDYVKIDVEATQTTFDGSEMDEDVTHETVEITSRTRDNTNIDGSASVADKWTVDKTFDDAIKISASIEIKASMSLKIYVDEYLDYTYVEALIKYSGKITASLSGEIEFPPIPLGRIGFDTEKLGIVAAIKFDFVVEGKSAISLTYTLEEGAVGLAYSSDIGLIDKRQAPTTNFTPELKSELTIFIGVSITPEIQATKHMEISLEAKAGLEIKGTIFDTGSDEQHICSVCIDGEAAFKLEATAAVRFFDWIENEWTLIEIEAKLGNFYVSFDNGWNFGTCPNRAYKVTVVVYDKTTGKPVNDVTVNLQYTPDETGVTTLYLKNGTHTITVDHSTGNLYTNEITIYNVGKNIEFSVDFSSLEDGDDGDDNIDPDNPDISEPDIEDTRTVTDSGTCGDNLTWTLYDDGELVIDGTGAMTDYLSSPWYSYQDSITSVSIGNSVTTIGKYAFYYCTSLTRVTIGNCVTAINYDAFCGCTSLVNITIPDSVTTIGSHAFFNCGLVSVAIPNNVTTIGSYAFACSDNLNSVSIPSSVTIIGNYAFSECSNLSSVTIGDGVTTIGSHAFYECDSLVNIKIPDSITQISSYAFHDCSGLTSITIPRNVTSIGYGAFRACQNLISITVEENNSNYSNDEYGVLFNENKSILIQCPMGTNITEYVIPNSVTSISDESFFCCNIKSITIPDSVTSIGSYAFGYVYLKTVYYTGTQEQWDAISIGLNNTPLTSANIICSDTAAPAMFMLRSIVNEVAAYSPRAAVQSETVTSAVVGNSYVIFVVKDANAEDLLASDNLLYIDQKIAESETLTFDFDLNGETDYDVIVNNAELDHYHKYTAVVTAPTCTEQGYTTYTCYCGDTYVSSYVPVVGHDYVAVVTAPTCTEQGYTTYACTCGDTYTGDYVDALGHTETIISGVPADCTNNGITDGVICLECQTELTAQESIPAIGHVNSNGDSSCDSCGHDLSEECSHICHGNAFLKFFWQIALFFSKLFNIQSNRYCDCGIAHW